VTRASFFVLLPFRSSNRSVYEHYMQCNVMGNEYPLSTPLGFPTSHFQQKLTTHQASSAVSRTVSVLVLTMTGCEQVFLRLPEYGVYRHVTCLHA